MDIAITGGTGFIGRALVLRHLAGGDAVRVLSRRPVDQSGFPDVVKLHSGDLVSEDNSELLSRFVDGADVLYHCAGEINNSTRMRPLHVGGTFKLVQAARGSIGHFVQLSSVGTYGSRRHGVITERTPLQPVGIYEITKAESDEVVRRAADSGAFSCTVLRPSIVFGPGMRNRSLRQMTAMIDRGLFFFIGPRGASANYIPLDNVIEALCVCGRAVKARGTVYNLSDYRTVEDFVSVIAEALGKARPNLRMPEGPVRFAARTIGKFPGFPLTESRVDALTTRVIYPATKMKQELGYHDTKTVEDALSLFVRDWRASR